MIVSVNGNCQGKCIGNKKVHFKGCVCPINKTALCLYGIKVKLGFAFVYVFIAHRWPSTKIKKMPRFFEVNMVVK